MKVDETISLNCGSIYKWNYNKIETICEEFNFLSFVKSGEIILNEEHLKYEWLNIDKFVEKITWNDNKELLKRILKKAMNKEKYFDKMTIKDYRKNK